MARVILDEGAVERAIARFCQASCGAGAGGAQFCLFRSPAQAEPSDEDMADATLPGVRLHTVDFAHEPSNGVTGSGAYATVTATFQVYATSALMGAHPARYSLVRETIARLGKAIGGAVIADDDTGGRGENTHRVRLELTDSGCDPPEPAGAGSERLPSGFALFTGRAERISGNTFESG